MAKVAPFASTASIEFLQTQIFEWVKVTTGAQPAVGCVDFVLGALAAVAAEHAVLVPVSDLYVESPLIFGSVTIRTFPDTPFQQFEARRLPGTESPEQYRAWCKSMRSDFQGLAVAEARLFGEPVRARQLAIERIELVVGILRFFAPAHRDGKVVSRIARWGYAPERTETSLLLTQPGDALISRLLSSIGLRGH
jgi:hypothetical protein